MSEQERQLRELEEEIPLLAGPAFAAARERARLSGQKLIETIDNAIYEISPDGSQQLIRHIGSKVHVSAGTRVRIK